MKKKNLFQYILKKILVECKHQDKKFRILSNHDQRWYLGTIIGYLPELGQSEILYTRSPHMPKEILSVLPETPVKLTLDHFIIKWKSQKPGCEYLGNG